MDIKYFDVEKDGVAQQHHTNFNKAKRQADRLYKEFPESKVEVVQKSAKSNSLLGVWLKTLK